VGTNPGVVIRDRPGLYPLLLSLDGIRDLDALRRQARREIPELTVDVAEALAPMIAAGLVVDTPRKARPTLRVDLAHDGPSSALARTITSLLARSGIAVGPDPDLIVILSSGEPDRATLADAVDCRMNHLPVVLDGDVVRIGPFVVPGRSPCVGCTDLHRATWDPGWPALVPQFGRAVRHDVSILAQHIAAAEVAAACLEFADGSLPDRLGRIRTVGIDRRVRVDGHAAFHPRCACSLLSAA
jgi:hypothetical protein